MKVLLRNILQVTLRLAVLVIMFVLVFRQIDEQQLAELLTFSLRHNWPFMVLALAFTYVGLHCGALRWHRLLVATGSSVPFGVVYRQFFLGQFFNAFMPGACGGDVARAVVAVRAQPSRRGFAISTVLVDRAIGLIVTMGIGCMAILLRARLFSGRGTATMSAVLMFTFLAGSFGVLALLFSRHIFEHFSMFRKFEQSPLGGWLRKAYDTLYFYRANPQVLGPALWLSILNLTALTAAAASVGRALGVSAHLVDYLTFFPIITVLAAIPITPGSLGVRENLFIAFFATTGTPPEKAVLLSLGVYATGLFWGLAGGLALLSRQTTARSQQEPSTNPNANHRLM